MEHRIQIEYGVAQQTMCRLLLRLMILLMDVIHPENACNLLCLRNNCGMTSKFIYIKTHRNTEY